MDFDKDKVLPRHTNIGDMARALKKTIQDSDTAFRDLHAFYEWRRREDDEANVSPWNDASRWRRINGAATVDWSKTGADNHDLAIWTAHDEVVESSRLDPNKEADKWILKEVGYPNCPILTSVDGGTKKDVATKTSRTTSAMVIFNKIGDGDGWEYERPVPMVIRVMVLPPEIGITETDNDHGELMATVMAEEALPKDAIALVVGDSTAARSKYLRIRDQDYPSRRVLIRRVYSGISKAFTFRLERELQDKVFPTSDSRYNPEQPASIRLREMLRNLQGRISDKKEAPWRAEYSDSHLQRASIKVDSHQLKRDRITNKGRYQEITPNLCLAAMNQEADNAASYFLGTLDGIPYEPMEIAMPSRIANPIGPRFETVIGNDTCDRDTSKAIRNSVDQDFLRRMQLRGKQGAGFRAAPYCERSCQKIPNRGTAKRLFQGIANCHSCSCYKDPSFKYRMALYYIGAPRVLPKEDLGLKEKREDLLVCPLCQDLIAQDMDESDEELEGGDNPESGFTTATPRTPQASWTPRTPRVSLRNSTRVVPEFSTPGTLAISQQLFTQATPSAPGSPPALVETDAAPDLPKGSTEHLHLHCKHWKLSKIRREGNQLVDDACKAYLHCLQSSLTPPPAIQQCHNLAVTLRRIEISSVKAMNTLCMEPEKKTRLNNITYKTTMVMAAIVLLQSEGQGPNNPVLGEHPFARLLGLTSDLQESELPRLNGASALDFSHIGLYPDALYEWHEENCKKVSRAHRETLKTAWHRIEATLIARPEIMQRGTKFFLDQFEKTVLKVRYPVIEPSESKRRKRAPTVRSRYGGTKAKPRPYNIDADDEMARALGTTNESGSNTGSTPSLPIPPRQTDDCVCAGITCKLARRDGKEVGSDSNTKERRTGSSSRGGDKRRTHRQKKGRGNTTIPCSPLPNGPILNRRRRNRSWQ
jgi:hypothetical protein